MGAGGGSDALSEGMGGGGGGEAVAGGEGWRGGRFAAVDEATGRVCGEVMVASQPVSR